MTDTTTVATVIEPKVRVMHNLRVTHNVRVILTRIFYV